MLWWIGGVLVVWLLVAVAAAFAVAKVLHVADRDEYLVEMQRDRAERCCCEEDHPPDPGPA